MFGQDIYTPKERALYINTKPPPFFLLGSAKCGTTAFFSLLLRHPQILCLHPLSGDQRALYTKEPHFFNDPWAFRRGIAYYEARMPDPGILTNDKTTLHYIDASPTYIAKGTQISHLLKVVYGYNQEFKFMAIIREPVDAAYSMYRMLARPGQRAKLMAQKENGTAIVNSSVLESFENETIKAMDVFEACAANWPDESPNFLYDKCSRLFSRVHLGL